jgi:hypothetical protein
VEYERAAVQLTRCDVLKVCCVNVDWMAGTEPSETSGYHCGAGIDKRPQTECAVLRLNGQDARARWHFNANAIINANREFPDGHG